MSEPGPESAEWRGHVRSHAQEWIAEVGKSILEDDLTTGDMCRNTLKLLDAYENLVDPILAGDEISGPDTALARRARSAGRT